MVRFGTTSVRKECSALARYARKNGFSGSQSNARECAHLLGTLFITSARYSELVDRCTAAYDDSDKCFERVMEMRSTIVSIDMHIIQYDAT